MFHEVLGRNGRIQFFFPMYVFIYMAGFSIDVAPALPRFVGLIPPGLFELAVCDSPSVVVRMRSRRSRPRCRPVSPRTSRPSAASRATTPASRASTLASRASTLASRASLSTSRRRRQLRDRRRPKRRPSSRSSEVGDSRVLLKRLLSIGACRLKGAARSHARSAQLVWLPYMIFKQIA